MVSSKKSKLDNKVINLEDGVYRLARGLLRTKFYLAKLTSNYEGEIGSKNLCDARAMHST